MKKNLLFFGLFLSLWIQLRAQTIEDQSQILQKCIDIPALQQYLPINAQNGMKQVYIMQSPISFPTDLSLSGSDKAIFFMTTSEIKENKIESYFMFRNIEINQNSSKVSCQFFHDYNYENKKANYFAINVNLQKVNSEWIVTNSDMKGGSF